VNLTTEYRPAGHLYLIAGLGLIFWPLFFADNPFFGDTVLYSHQADWYLKSGFSSLILPNDLDAGHPPFFSIYLAMGWNIFGQSLWVAHALMLPVLLCLAWALVNCISYFLPPSARLAGLVLVLAEPTLMAQATLPANDLVIVTAILLSITGIYKRNSHLIGLAFLAGGSVSLRGIIYWPVIVLFAGLYFPTLRYAWKFWLKVFVYTFPLMLWFAWHYFHSGWLTTPHSENWKSQHAFTDFDGIIHNFLSVIFRFVDHGRIFISLTALSGILYLWLKPKGKLPPLAFLLCAGITLHLILFLPYNNPPGHRYFLTWFILMALYAVRVIYIDFPGKRRVYLLLLFASLSGHFWIYPDTIAKGWDSSLAYLPWVRHREAALTYMKQQMIIPEKTGTSFPLRHAGRYSHLNGENWQMPEKDLNTQVYVLYSNLCSGFSEEEISILEKQWDIEQSWGTWPVRMILYRNPEQIPSIPSGKEMAFIEP